MLDFINKGRNSTNQWIALSILCLYVVLSIVWHFSSIAPWDDDCVVRYLNCREAFSEPYHFISLWNRPLSTVTFCLPVQLGRHGILFMVLLSAINAWLLFKVCIKLNLKNSFLVIPFLLFQVFYFTISRNLLAEPLAALVITAGFLCYLDRKWFLFAILGGLLPLARLELSVLLIVWFSILVWNRQWKYIPLLGLPCVLWSLAGTIIDGGAFWLLDQTFGKENDKNRYGHQTFGHYFQRYIYIIGPIVFYFFIIGFLESLYRKKVSLFLTLQFIITFMLYVVFSWKLNMGQAAGFLRHLATISPLAAIFALMGFNYWIQPFRKVESASEKVKIKEWTSIENKIRSEAEENDISNKELKNRIRAAKHDYKEEIRLESVRIEKNKKEDRQIKSSRFRIIGYSITILILTYIFFSFNLLSSHKIGEDSDWLNLIFISILTLGFFGLLISKLTLGITQVRNIALTLTLGLMIYTLVKEHPDAHNNPERQEFSKLHEVYKEHFSSEKGCYVNHPWFYWASNEQRDSTKYKLITQENLRNAPDSSVILWESHYSRRLAGDVDIRFLDGSNDYMELYRMRSSDNKFQTALFKKVQNWTFEEKLSEINNFISKIDDNPVSYYTRAKIYLRNGQDLSSAKLDCDKAIGMDSTNASTIFLRGQLNFKLKNYESAIVDYQKTLEIKDDFLLAYVNIGKSYAMQGKFEEAVDNYSKAITIKDKPDQVFLNRALAYIKLTQYDEALVDLQKVIELKSKNIDLAFYNAGIIMALKNKADKARQYFEAAARYGHEDAKNILARSGG